METIPKIREWLKGLKTYQKVLLLLLVILLILLLLSGFFQRKATTKITGNEKPELSSVSTNQATPVSVKKILDNVSENSEYDVVVDDRQPEQFKFPKVADIIQNIKVTISPDAASNLPAGQPLRVLFYGIKSKQNTELREVHLDGNNNHVVAYLPANIKDVHPVSDHGLIYIAGVDEFDHGDRLEIFDTKTQKSFILTTVTPGWGIDDIVISPDNRFIAIWEVKFVPGKKVMLDGLSAIYLYDLGSGKRNQIIVEKAVNSSPIHYPRFFDYKNRLFMDLWIPNQGRQFFLGMSYVEAENPTQIVSVTELSRGRFNSAPVLAPLGNKILFSSFDPNANVVLPTTSRETPKRPELDNPNQLTILNLDDLTPLIYTDKSDTRFYVDPKWSPDGREILYLRYNPQISNPPFFEGVYVLNLESMNERKIPGITDENTRPVKYLGKSNFIYQTRNYIQGNLGEKYAPVTDGFYGFENGRGAPIAQGSNLQYISNLVLQPKTNIVREKGITAQSAFILPGAVLPTPNKSQSVAFETFDVDPLAFRSGQQNDIVTQVADNSTKDPDAIPTNPPDGGGDDGGDDGGGSCADEWNCGEGYPTSPCWAEYLASDCHDSPLYLYPTQKTDVRIKPVLSGQIQYEWPKLTGNFWQVVARPDGSLINQENISFDKIEYSFTTSGIKPPQYGYVVSAVKLREVLELYAAKVGLNTKESADFVSFWTGELNKVPTPYYFVSHYDKEQAAKIISFDITPKPETFIQLVMYFKPLNDPFSVLPPIFDPVPSRKGFVAVDWSGKIDL